ncbi:TrkA C-terminal domain-containing protein [Halobacterium salinarum]|uniref:PhoU/TrkA-C domain protein n=1 Tax=Halobacterium salinarum (strain ATCC 33171 / DSM 3754 / JCM 8978 / NBRC 102687 / NCIMB 764 / 91-R6) TaxID=2597657 RepID=A0A4D6GX76_HALS9|nr:potassium channel family protein [Halobacterium salinarum]MDL0125221.1 TrkA C-terminal domain-containing protein [Halobacterium salinarum]MDL0139777.1 TrkA C-terminal domain-containing protein [Halobacterium salinarum]MDL0145773.1 TrkA C-terminal domain-containing protein [Halobacterium salinarum]QCC45736.1 PhoU/TrkA-C domain protein [Halobacterium salinarum]TYO81995.1 putative conserved protein, contains PhoU and TrkA_C domains [Halobacterium salinarum DSM 3754]
MGGRVEYEPASAKDLLVELKDTAELLVDLSFSAVLHGSDNVADEVLRLEKRMDVLQLRARMTLLLAARSPADAESLAPVLGVVAATEKMSDAAGDIAKVVREDVGLPDAMQGALPDAAESLVRGRLVADSRYADRTLGDVDLETNTGVRVIAVRRGDGDAGDWLPNPGPETTLRPADVLLLRGPTTGVEGVYETVTGTAYDPPAPSEPAVADLGRAVTSVALMKNMSELAVDLAYGAVLFDDDGLAEEVVELEAEVDALKSRFEAWTLRAATDIADPVSLRGLMQIATATEVISDAAVEISEGVLRGLDTHIVVQEAVEASDEVVVRVPVGAGGELPGTTLGDQRVKTRTGMRIIAVRRGATSDTGDVAAAGSRDGHRSPEDAWVIEPGPETTVRASDVLLAKGTRSGAQKLRELAGA